MGALTGAGEQAIAELATRYGVSVDAVRVLLDAVRRGGGTMAQFSHPELGGSGQWMAGGMTMVGTPFDHRLQATVSGLAGELAALLASTPMYVPAPTPVAAGESGVARLAEPGSWWPAELGQAGSSGGQNDTRYAVFPLVRRLALRSGTGPVRVYDTLDHAIGGVQQQQGGRPGTLTFTSQHGTFTVDTLPLVGPADPTPAARATASGAGAAATPAPPTTPAPPASAAPAGVAGTPAPPAAAAWADEAGEPSTSDAIVESPAGPGVASVPEPTTPGTTAAAAPASAPPPGTSAGARSTAPAGTDADVVLTTLARLGELHERGVLTDEEFAAKKAELLARL